MNIMCARIDIQGSENMNKATPNVNTDIKNYIYLEEGNELYKFEIKFNHMDITNAIEQYINRCRVIDFEVRSEQYLKENAIPKIFFPYLGKFKLEENLKSTKNYFVLNDKSYLYRLLTVMYWDNSFTPEHFEVLYDCYNECCLNKQKNKAEFILDFSSKMNIELKNKYKFEELKSIISNLENYVPKDELEKSKEQYRWMFESAKKNKSIISGFGLNDKFYAAINKEQSESKERQKIFK